MTATNSHRWAFVALLVGNLALAGGPFLVRHAGVGPVAAGFWRVTLAIPFLWLIARLLKQPVRVQRRAVTIAIGAAALFFAADLAAWHAGILLTKLGNATLFGNISSFFFAAWGLWLARRWTRTGCPSRCAISHRKGTANVTRQNPAATGPTPA